ncbi:hypothetical protein [Mucilaginibacter psychrotolerans]|uniref:Uncharacterized protein n=1 Tax=Mucilaginibacter psychrotolerans TaxID=1524096 RepID=A0A4Y8S6D6_9SPHI|nr:hypothetical protein [Mucilaginibacter psychrotolerans]TFF33954.1 hypothetical protein E2R66_23525 [Mucilaginibacter psychrotolerans]
MLSEKPINPISGNISFGITADDSIKAVIGFLRINLLKFASDNKNHRILPEESTNQLLCGFLNKEAKKEPFRFQPEFIEEISSGRSPKVDFGTLSDEEKIVISDREYGEDDSFFSFEAKRLPTPGSGREREYVTGIAPKVSGGIERFKKGVHGAKIKYAAIVGYVQKETFNHWFLKINGWIDELAVIDSTGLWKTTDKLACDDINVPVFIELFSAHNRIATGATLTNIELYHFWIDLIEPVAEISESDMILH